MRIKILKTALFGLIFSISNFANAGLIVVDTSSNFVIPDEVTSISVLAIGGGGAGAGSHWGGGGSGYLAGGTFAVSAGDIFSITIGQGGQAANCAGNSCLGDDGSATVFDNLLTANGGFATNGSIGYRGGNGGSGGGGAGNSGFGGSGGTGGSDGLTGRSYIGGIGQGSSEWDALLALISEVQVTAGNGGDASASTHGGGGGGGGILIDGIGLIGGTGNSQLFSAGVGGSGYGAGGGSGGYDAGTGYQVGGNGADGVVLIQFSQPVNSVPEPSTFAIFALGALGLTIRKIKKHY